MLRRSPSLESTSRLLNVVGRHWSGSFRTPTLHCTGETSRNLYTRALEHKKKYEEKASDSFINNHQIESHDGSDPIFTVKVVGSYRDPLSRQVAEGVLITNTKILNSKAELFQPPIVRLRREVDMGS